MATKKQKREAALAKRAAFEEKHRLSGLKAQRADQKRRESRRQRAKEDAARANRQEKVSA